MTLTPVVQHHHVEEAIRLFKFSTMDAVMAGSAEGLSRGELNDEMVKIERELRRRLPVGWSTSYQSLVREFVSQQGYSSHALERALFIMEKREIIRYSGQKKTVHRCVHLHVHLSVSCLLHSVPFIGLVFSFRVIDTLICAFLLFISMCCIYVKQYVFTTIRIFLTQRS